MGYQAEIKELTSFVLMIVIVLYTVTVVANLVRAQSSYLTGSSYKYGNAVESIIVLSLLLAAGFAVSMILYVAYYRMEEMKAFYAAMIPLVTEGVSMGILVVLLSA